MRKVLHVGPCDAPGGMATVMQTLAEHPPEGWEAELLSSHAQGGLWSKWRAYRRARRALLERCKSQDERPDIVHFHSASDWSWRRKHRLARLVRAYGVSVVIHFHSGKFDRWLASQPPKRVAVIHSFLHQEGVVGVVLSDGWRSALEPFIGPTSVVPNPVRSTSHSTARDANHLLVLGRPDPVKGHAFAEQLVTELRSEHSSLTLTLTGLDRTDTPGVNALGWVSEQEKQRLLQTASLLLVPSGYEGQPMVMLEALACGLPVCTSDRLLDVPSTVGVAAYGNLEDWKTKVNAMLVQPPTSEAMQAAVGPHQIEAVANLWSERYASLIKP